MAAIVANLPPAAPPAAAPVRTPAAGAVGGTGAFGAALAAAVATTPGPPGTTPANQADDRTKQNQDANALGTAAALAGGALIAVPQTPTVTTPTATTNTATTQTATGIATPITTVAVLAGTPDIPVVAATTLPQPPAATPVLAQPVPATPTNTTPTPAPVPTATPAPPAPAVAPPALPTVLNQGTQVTVPATPPAANTAVATTNPQPDVTLPVPTGASATATAPPIPAQAPIVTDVNRPAGGVLAQPIDPTSGPTATESVASLPAVPVGDRPATAGERIAAIISSATRLTSATAPATPTGTTFADALTTAGTGVVAAPRPSALSTIGTVPGIIEDRTAGFAAPAAANANPAATAPPPAPAATATPSAQAAATPTPAAQVADGVIGQVRTLDRGATEFQIRLDPPNLGQIRVHLVTDADGLRGQVVVGSDSVRHLLESQLPELRQRLEAAGLNVQRFDVTTGSGSGAANTGQGRPQWTPPIDSPPAPAPARVRTTPSAVAPGRIDVTV